MTKTLEKIINEFGSLTKDQALEKLRSEGAKGRKDSVTKCILNEYLFERIGQKLSVGTTRVNLYEGSIIKLPECLQEIVRDFDFNRLPDEFYRF